MEKLDVSCSDAFVGSVISLTSKSEIRYEGILFTLDTEKSTVVLKDVRSFGTEGRGTNSLHIPPNSKVYEYIIFRKMDIKDLEVVAFSCNLDKSTEAISERINPQEKVQNHLSGHCSDTCLGWPVSPQSSQLQEGANVWQWLYSSAASSSYGISPNALLATFPNSENKTAPLSSWSSFLQENYDTPVTSSHAKLSTFEQVPTFIPRTQSLAVSQHPSACGREHMTGHENFLPKSSPKRDKFHSSSSQVRPLWQQPLLPLPVSESEHRRLIRQKKGLAGLEHGRRSKVSSRGRSKKAVSEKDPSSSTCQEENKGLAGLEHGRRPKVSSSGRPKGVVSEKDLSSTNCQEASCSILDVSKDFDFEAMNQHFNKKDVWNHIELNERQEMHISGKQEEPSQTVLDTRCLSRKAHFVDGFFDLSLSEDGSCKENRPKGSNIVQQREIDSETFGVSSLPRNERRRGIPQGALWGGQRISIRTK